MVYTHVMLGDGPGFIRTTRPLAHAPTCTYLLIKTSHGDTHLQFLHRLKAAHMHLQLCSDFYDSLSQ